MIDSAQFFFYSMLRHNGRHKTNNTVMFEGKHEFCLKVSSCFTICCNCWSFSRLFGLLDKKNMQELQVF